MKLATWNVNSLKVRLPQLLQWLGEDDIDVLALQETKLVDERFPVAELTEAGYVAVFDGQPTYNGVAILCRTSTVGTPKAVVKGIPGLDDPQKRLLAVTLDNGLRVVCGYFPNGQSLESEKFPYKLRWIDALTEWLASESQSHPQLVLAGDFNIAPENRDVHDPAAWEGQVLCSDAERSRFQGLLKLGFYDSFRLFDQPERLFSWWDYRQLGFRRNAGLRIDHLLVSEALRPSCRSCGIVRRLRALPQPSDHAPVVLELAL